MSPRKQLRCRRCDQPITFFRRPNDGKVLPFDPTPATSGHPLAGIEVYPIYGMRAWRTRDLVEHMQVLHEYSSTEAEQQVQDMPWHRTHSCSTNPTDKD